ncbi:MAG: hypothetical protein SF182_06430 [Deltaproteobacteria bacterium]|nr:hypothetical protein [Deltaproteobacteria bacterium]
MPFRLLVLLLTLAPGAASALTVLSTGKSLAIRHGWTAIRVGADPALATLVDPSGCPGAVSVRIAAYPTARNLVIGPPAVALPCEHWAPVANGWLYRDDSGSAGGTRLLRYTTRGLVLLAAAPGFALPPGPVGFVQADVTIGTTRYHVRFHDFRRNQAAAIASPRASRAAGEAERAFWQTLFGEAELADRALALLTAVADREPANGRAPFLAAMTHLYLFGEAVTAYPRATPAQSAHIDAARAHFARALPLLYQPGVGDTRAPGFASGTTYVAGVLAGDDALRAQGVAEMAAAAEINPLFNAFNPIGAVPPAVFPSDPEYAGALRLLDEYFPQAALQCAGPDGVQGEICFNDGLAPHNLEGTFLFFGDVYAKAGRVEAARNAYQTSFDVGRQSGWRAEFLAEVQQRLDDLPANVARFQDADPDNDPPMLGVANRGCAHCHFQ